MEEETGLSREFIQNLRSKYLNLKKHMKKVEVAIPVTFEHTLQKLSQKSRDTGYSQTLKDEFSNSELFICDQSSSKTRSQIQQLYREVNKTSKKLNLSEQALNMKERENLELKIVVNCLSEQLESEDSTLEVESCHACILF